MARVKGGTTTKARRKKILKLASGYFGSKHTLYRTAREQVLHSLQYAYRDRRQTKRNFRKLWISRINAAAQLNDMKYSRLIHGLSLANVALNRKVLADLAVSEPTVFASYVALAKDAIANPSKFAVKVEKPVAKVVEKAPAPKAEAPKKEAPKAEVAVDFDSMTVAELKDLAKAKGISGISALKKADLIEALKNA
jgi:large subunit ribosomal protein L20